MATIFTKIIAGEIPCYKIAENEKFLAFLDINPLTVGHTIVIPKKETDFIFDIEDKELADFMVFTKRISAAINKTIPCKRVGVLVIGTEVPHAHIHLIPFNKETEMNMQNQRVKMLSAEFTATAKQIAEEVRL